MKWQHGHAGIHADDKECLRCRKDFGSGWMATKSKSCLCAECTGGDGTFESDIFLCDGCHNFIHQNPSKKYAVSKLGVTEIRK